MHTLYTWQEKYTPKFQQWFVQWWIIEDLFTFLLFSVLFYVFISIMTYYFFIRIK